MNTLQRNRRTRRNAQFTLEYLDERIVLSTMHATAGAGAEAMAVVSAAQRHGKHLAHHHGATAMARTSPMIVNVSGAAATAGSTASGPSKGVSPALAMPVGTRLPISPTVIVP